MDGCRTAAECRRSVPQKKNVMVRSIDFSEFVRGVRRRTEDDGLVVIFLDVEGRKHRHCANPAVLQKSNCHCVDPSASGSTL